MGCQPLKPTLTNKAQFYLNWHVNVYRLLYYLSLSFLLDKGYLRTEHLIIISFSFFLNLWRWMWEHHGVCSLLVQIPKVNDNTTKDKHSTYCYLPSSVSQIFILMTDQMLSFFSWCAALGKNCWTLLQNISWQSLRFEHLAALVFCFFHSIGIAIDRSHCVFVLWKINCKYLVVNSTCVKNNCELHTVCPQL